MESALRRLLRTARQSARTRSQRTRQQPNHSTEPTSLCTLTYGELYVIYQEQQGRCAISGLPLSLLRTQPYSISLERHDTSRGYTAGNVSLICLVLNSTAGWTREKFDYLLQARETWQKCSSFVHMDPDLVPWSEQLRVRCQYLLRTAQTNRRSIPCTLTLSMVKQQYFLQRGRCAYSGLLLRLSSRVPHFQMSLERVHRHQGYQADNICLIIRELNVGGVYGNVNVDMVNEWRRSCPRTHTHLQETYAHQLHAEHVRLYTERVQHTRQCQRCEKWCLPEVFRETRQGNHRVCRSCRSARQREIRYTCVQAAHPAASADFFHISDRTDSPDRGPPG